ncbi:MAG: HEXXH motif-containing putative peptide modification protein [Bacteroidota bacterium]
MNPELAPSPQAISGLLDFRLPPFLRLSWASKSAGEVWADRIEALRSFQYTLEVASVSEGLREVALLESIDPDIITLPEGLVAHTISEETTPEWPGPPIALPAVVVGTPAATQAFVQAWEAADLTRVGELLGYPTCCVEHFAEAFAESRLWDTAWAWDPSTDATPQPASGIHPLLAKIGISRTPHVPCGPDCEASHSLAEAWEALALSLGKEELLNWRAQLLDGPIHWSARHGIAEVKTALFRYTTDVAATEGTYILALEGSTSPEEAAIGGKFPYRKPRKFAVTGKQGWQRGLDQAFEKPDPASFSFRRVRREELPPIDWARVAIPQVDGYDTEIIRQCATLRFARTGKWEDLARHQTGAATMLEGATQIIDKHHPHPLGEEFDQAPTDHPSYARCTELLQRWPEGYRQCQGLVHTLQPAVQRDVETDDQVFGSCSHAFEMEFGTFYATVHDAYALAQAMVHEMAHMKLFALGFGKESTGHLIMNPLHEEYSSTIRTDKPRPMSAVIHAQYSFIHVVALDLYMLQKETDRDAQAHLLRLLARNVERMEIGYQTIDENVKLTPDGEAFFGAFMTWSRRVLDQGQRVLKENT